MADDGGVLGNLPRSRPGQRSEKRTETTAAKAAARAERSGSQAAAPARGAQSRARARRKAAPSRTADTRERAARPPDRDAAAEQVSHADPVGDAIRTVTGVAGAGARLASGVAREVLRRLPRP